MSEEASKAVHIQLSLGMIVVTQVKVCNLYGANGMFRCFQDCSDNICLLLLQK